MAAPVAKEEDENVNCCRKFDLATEDVAWYEVVKRGRF